MSGSQLKRPGPPLGEHSVIQHTPPSSLHTSSRPAAEDCPSPSKRKKSCDQVQELSHFNHKYGPGSDLSDLYLFLLHQAWDVVRLQVSHRGLQHYNGQSLSGHHSSGHPIPPKPAFWNPLHKNDSTPWLPSTRKTPQSQEFQV